jgi:phosphatidylserine synthase
MDVATADLHAQGREPATGRGILIAALALVAANLALLCADLRTGRMHWTAPAIGLLSPILILLRARFPKWSERHRFHVVVIAWSAAVALMVVWGTQAVRPSPAPPCRSRTVPSETRPFPDALSS